MRLPDFLQDHMAFDLDLAGLEHRVQHDVGNHVEREPGVVSENAGVIGGHLARGIGVDIAAHVLDRLGDLKRVPGLGALERHMFEEMRDAVLIGALVPPAGIDPDADRGRAQPRHVLGHDADAVRHTIEVDCHRRRFSLITASIAPRSFGTRVTRSDRS